MFDKEDIAREVIRYENELTRFSQSLASKYRLRVSRTGYIAYMQHKNKTITIGAEAIGELLEPVLPTIQNLGVYIPMFIYKFTCGLIWHEFGHVKYTPNQTFVEDLAKAKNIKSPKWWFHWVINVVEDSFIQNKLRQDYPGSFTNECLSYVEAVSQGQETAKEFAKKDEHDVKMMLFYLVLLAYNRDFEKPESVKISDELVDEFLSIYYVDSNEERVSLTLDFADKLLAELFEEGAEELARKIKITITNKPQPPGQQQEDIDLDDYDEVEVEFDIDPNIEDEETEDEEGQSMPAPGTGKDSEETDGESDDGSDGEDSDSGDSESADSSAQGQGKSDSDAEGTEEEDNGSSSNVSIGTESGKGESKDDLTTEDVMNYFKEIVEELEKDKPKSEGDYEADDIDDDNILDRVSVANNIKQRISGGSLALNNFATDMKTSFTTEFKRIQAYTFNKTVHNLPTGRFTQRDAFRTSFSKNVFHQRFEPKREMDLFCGVSLDASGSMNQTVYGTNSTLYGIMSDIITGLVDALTQVKAKTEVLAFDSNTIRVKDYFTNPAPEILYADLKSAFNILGGGTNMLSSIHYFESAFKLKVHKDKALIIFTDGATANEYECAKAVDRLVKQGVLVIGIGLQLGYGEQEYFENIFRSAYHKNYESADDIKDRLAKDLRELLSNTFMKNKI